MISRLTISKANIASVMFALIVLLCGGCVVARAQESQASQDAKPAQQDSARAPDTSQAQPASQEKESPETQRRRGPGQELVHETREAAGEEKDETAEFKQSSSVRLVGRLTGLGPQRAYQLCVALNFIVIGGAILWAGAKYLPGLFRDRTSAIQKAMTEAQKASEEARRKLAEIEARLAKLDAEIASIRDSAEREAAAEEARIKAAAEDDARKIVASAEQEIAAAAKAARRALTIHAADLAVGLARKQIQVDAKTDQALVRDFAGQLAADGKGKA